MYIIWGNIGLLWMLHFTVEHPLYSMSVCLCTALIRQNQHQARYNYVNLLQVTGPAWFLISVPGCTDLAQVGLHCRSSGNARTPSTPLPPTQSARVLLCHITITLQITWLLVYLCYNHVNIHLVNLCYNRVNIQVLPCSEVIVVIFPLDLCKRRQGPLTSHVCHAQ